MRTFTEMALDGPVDYEGNRVTTHFDRPCLIASVQVERQVSWSGKSYGTIRAVEFHNAPSEKELSLTAVCLNPLQWKGAGYSYQYTPDVKDLAKFIEYLSGFDKEFTKKMQAYLGCNYPVMEVSPIAPSPSLFQ